MEFIEKFKNYLLVPKRAEGLQKSGGSSAATIKNYLADIKQFVTWVESTYKKSFNPEDITLQTIQEFKTQKASTLSASSMDRHISSLRKFFTFLKLDGQIPHSPFDPSASSGQATDDPYRLHDFKNYLYVYNASNLTIKNYVIDVKQFLSWAEEVLRTKEAWQVSDKNLLGRIDNKLVEEYKNRLLVQHVFSPSSINRKLSSLRKYLSWAGENGLLGQMENGKWKMENFPSQTNENTEIPENKENQLSTFNSQLSTYSNIPPIRLFQKLAKAGTLTFDLLIVAPVAHAFRKVEHETWKLKGKKIFISSENMPHLHKFPSFSSKPHFSNISKEFYSPLSISTRDFPWYKKIFFHIRHTRPQWYHRYHQLAIAHYFNWAVLIIFATAIGFGMYNNFVQKPDRSLAALPNQPIRVLSFQGRLTDANDNPITSPTNIRFIIYNTQSSSSSARLWEEVDKVSPDQDGIFSLLLGSSGASDGSAAALCNSGNPPSSPTTGACGIPQSLFANNSALWLGVTVEATSELSPREQLATVAFASNAETLQGLPPITQSGAGTNNVVLALNSSGNLSIGASTTFQSTSGAFNLSGNTLALNTNAGSGGNITLAPDGLGMVDIQRPVLNSSNYGDIASVPNAFTIEDLAAILATSSGQSALTINQNGTGPIISASHSGTPEFTVDSSGNTTVNGNLTINGTQITDNTYAGNNAVLYAAPTTGLFTSLTTSTANQCLLSGGSIPKWASCNITGYWQLQGPVLSPADLNNDLAVGGNSTSSAKFQVFAESVGNIVAGTASTSGNLTFGEAAGTNPVINVLNGNSLTVKTSPGGDNGTGYTNALVVGSNTTQFYSGNSLSSNGNLTLAGTITLPNSNTLTGVANYLEVSNGISVGGATTYHIDSSGNAVLNSINLPITGGIDGYWSLNAGSLSPLNIQNDLVVGGTGTSSARFHAYGALNQGTTPSASVSGKTSYATFVVDNSGSGSIFTASTSGLAKFTILNSGSLQDSNYTTDKGIAYFDSTGLLSQTAQGASHTVLHGNGSSAPTFSAIDLTADAGTSILPVGNGGTGANLSSGAAIGDILYADSTSTFHRLAVGSSSQCLIGGTTPTWSTCPGGSSGTNYWQLNGKVVSPADLNNDLAVGGNSTSSAKFQVFAESVGVATAGTASTSGNLTFADAAGTNPIINVLNGNSLKIKTSPGGDTSPGYIDALIIAPNGNLTSAGSSFQLNGTNPVITAGGTNTLTLQSGATGNIQFFGSSNTLTSGGNLTLAGTITAANSNTINGLSISSGALSGITGYTQASGNFDMSGSSGTFQTGSGNVSINGSLATSLIPTGNGSINLGSSSHYYGTVYANAFSSPIGNGVSGFWTISNNTNLYPSSSSDDLLIGGTGTNSASFQVFSQSVSPIVAGTASTSGYLTFKDAAGTNPEINILNGNSLVFESSPGGDAGTGYGNILTLGNNSTTTTLSTASNNNNLSLLAGSGVTTIGTTGGGNIQFFGNSNTLTSGGNLTLAGTITLPHSITLTGQTSFLQLSDGLELGGGTTYKIDSSGNATLANVLPTSDGVGNIGASGTAWNNVYAKNINLPITGGLDGFWQLSTGANYGLLAPTNIQNDFAVAGASTSSAKFQVFGQNYTTDASINSGNVPAGTATTSGNFTFRGTAGSQTVFQQNLLNGSSLGFYESVGGDKGLVSTTPILYLANSGSVGIGTNAPSTTLDVAGNASISSILTFRSGAGTIQATSNNQLTLGGNTTGGITFGSNVNSSIVPTLADTFNLGSASNEWNNLYVRQIITPASGGIAGYWQLNSGALAPANLTNDLLVGGVATTSATFHVYGASLNQGTLAVASVSAHTSFAGLVVDNTIGDLFTASVSGTTQFVINKNGSVGVGTSNPLLLSGIDIEKNGLGNSVLDINQQGLGDIFTASVSGTTKFVINNNGNVAIGPSVTTAQGILDVASQGPNFPSDLTLNQVPATNLIANPSFEYTNNQTNTWSFNRTPEFAASNPATESAVFGSHALRMNSSRDSGSTFTATSQCIPVVGNASYTLSAFLKVNAGFAGNIGINFQTFTSRTCTSGQATAGRINTTTTGTWTRVTSSITTASTVAGIEAQWIADSSSTGIAYLDGVQLEQNTSATPYLDGSLGPGYVWDVTGLPNATDSSRLSGSAFAYQTINSAGGIGAAGRTSYPVLSLDQNGTGDILTASSSGVTDLQITNSGQFFAKNLYDIDNPIYYIDPAGLTVSASLASSLTFTPTSEHDINFLNGSNLNFQGSVGGDTLLTSKLFINGNSGFVGIGTTSPSDMLDIAGSATESGNLSFKGVNTLHNINALNGGQLAFNTSVGGTGTLNTALYIDKGNNTTAGFVGVNTTSPSDTLDISGNATESGNLSFRGTNTTHNLNILNGGNLSINTSVGGLAGTNPAIYLGSLNVASASALVGINNANPSRNFDVNGSWGGNILTSTVTNGTGGTLTFGAALYYDFDFEDTAGSSTQTENFNITGLPQVNGTWFMVKIRCHATAGDTCTAALQVNGTTLSTTSTGSGGNRTHGIYVYNAGWVGVAENTTNTDSIDLAETIPYINQQPIDGEILSTSATINTVAVERSKNEYNQKALGIVTTNPNTVYGLTENGNIPTGDTRIALAGRVPAIITSLDGPILKGDSIATSPLLGTGMKPLRPTQTVGKALEDFDPSQMSCTTVTSYDAINWPADNGTNYNHPCFQVPVSSYDAQTQSILLKEYHLGPNNFVYVGKVMVLVGNSYVDPNINLTTTGDLNIADSSPSASFTIPHYYTLSDALGNPISQMGTFLELAVGNLRAGSVNAQQVLTNSLAIATENVSVAGQSLKDYIISVVKNANLGTSTTTNSPVASINEIHTGIISPLGDNGQIAIRVNNSGIEIAKDASSSAVASIDNQGNATFSGTLNSQNLAVNGDATVSGTLYANNIKANSIEGLQEVVSTLSAQNITNVTNIFFATPSSSPTAPQIATGFNSNSSSNSGLLNPAGNFASIASYSAYFAYVPNLNATTGMFEQGLVSLGPTSLSDTSINGTLSIGSSLMLADNSINVLGNDFAIQPLRQGGVSFEGGLLAINTNGDLTVNGNAVFNKNLAVNTISPLRGGNVNVILNGSEGSSVGQDSSQTQNDKASNFNVQNASGSAIFAVNQLGDLVASGTATIGKLNLNLVQPALAISDTEVVATGSAGTATIKAYQREVTIDNPNVTANSLIYITPVGTNETPYLERQISDKSFSVGIPTATPNNVNFNWLIVN